MRRVLPSLVAALFLLILLAAPTAAAAEWCEHDPLVILTTPQGAQIPVWVTAYAQGTQYAPNLDGATITYEARPTREGTRFDVSVTVPEAPVAGRFKTRAVASTAPNAAGTVYDTDSGRSGRAMHLRFEVAAR